MNKNLFSTIITFGLLCGLSGCSTSSNTSSSLIKESTSFSQTEESISSNGSSETEKEYFYESYSNVLMPLTGSSAFYRGEIADPSIVKGDDGKYYVFSTLRKAFVSEDLIYWSLLTEKVIDRPTWADDDIHGVPDVWAPDVIKIQDKWIYYYSLAAWDKPSAGIGYAISDNIYGPYEDKGKLFDQDDIVMEGLIDPQPFIDDDGRVYMIVGSFHGNYLVELSPDGQSLLNGVEYQNEHKVLIAGIPLTTFNNSYYEGGYIIKRNGFYYFFGSAGSCCDKQNSTYSVYCGKSASISGPYLAPNGRDLALPNGNKTQGRLVIWGGSDSEKRVAGPGHNSVFIDDAGDYWMIYHAYCDIDNFATRHLFMDKLSWDDNDYPYVSYSYMDENNNEIVVNCKPSYEIELDGPKFIKE